MEQQGTVTKIHLKNGQRNGEHVNVCAHSNITIPQQTFSLMTMAHLRLQTCTHILLNSHF